MTSDALARVAAFPIPGNWTFPAIRNWLPRPVPEIAEPALLVVSHV